MPQDTTFIMPGTDQDYTSREFIDSLSTAIIIQKNAKEQEDFKAKSDYYSSFALPGTFVLLTGIWLLVKWLDGKNDSFVEIGSVTPPDTDAYYSNTAQNYLKYEGKKLKFSDEELQKILLKRFPYFLLLTQANRSKFLLRLRKFIAAKVFIIHDAAGFKEMPILISATAIQVSLGLNEYLLPNFSHMHIYPRDFLFTSPSIRFLEGNVSGNSINISWKHFLLGFENPENGANVGLHEMAHAYYYQNFECRNAIDDHFIKTYPVFDNCGNKIFSREKQPGARFYSDYALRNFQEFWAESVELFFEKPQAMQQQYPELYQALVAMLRQDPLLLRNHPPTVQL